jgi:hypothetical protein
VNDLVLWLSIAALFLGALALSLGVRGRRIDREPRCPARRCKYALGGVISAKRAQSEDPYPLTCPECGRSITQEREFRLGTRRRLTPLVVVGLALLLPSSGYLAFEGYARWQSANALSTMPLWLLMNRAQRDSTANRFVHQKELLARAEATKIDAKRAPAIVDRILDWQADPRVEVRHAADAVVELALQKLVTTEQAQRFWDHYYLFELVLPETVGAGEPLPFIVRADGRVGFRGGPIPEKSPWDGRGPPRPGGFNLGFESGMIVERVRIGDLSFSPEADHLRLRNIRLEMTTLDDPDFAWPSTSDVWDYVRAPERGLGQPVEVELTLHWDWPGAGQRGSMTDSKTRLPTNRDTWLKNRGITVGGALTLRGTTRVVEPDTIAVTEVRDPVIDAWVRDQISRASVDATRQPFGGISGRVDPGQPNFDQRLSDPPVIFADQELRFGDWVHPLRPIEVGAHTSQLVYGWIDDPDTRQLVGRLAIENPDGWSYTITPRPERSLRSAERPKAWAGDPITVPLPVAVTWHCFDPPPDPKLPD